jgi:ribosomal protein L44E
VDQVVGIVEAMNAARCCRVCLTTEEDVKFHDIEEETYTTIVALFKIKISFEPSNIICKQCERDINTAWIVSNRLQDASEFLDLQSKLKTRKRVRNLKGNPEKAKQSRRARKKEMEPITFECDNCQKTFDNMKSLDDHMKGH